MERSPFQLGPFTLDRILGAGGMGEVWHATHDASGTEAAIKVILAEQARDPLYRESFMREVRAAARLDHPNIIQLFDFGFVPERTAEDSSGALVAGSPFLAMAVASGSLEDHPLPLPTGELVRVLLDTLHGVAHAHARGVIHRDLKPANVLTVQDGALTRFVLSDFGIAHASERHGAALDDEDQPDPGDKAVGTPTYMAPEQFHAHWRDFGPWTDLYQVGIMAWELAAGQRPFDGESWIQVGFKHIQDPLPPLPASATLPDGFNGWLQRMCAKRPQDRFPRAADAARALQDLASRHPDTQAGAQGITTPPARARAAAAPTADAPASHALPINTADDTRVDTAPNADAAVATSAPTLPFSAAKGQRGTQDGGRDMGRPFSAAQGQWDTREGGRGTAPPLGRSAAMSIHASGVPADDDATPASLLTGAGAGLFGLRTVPLVDREDARETLWRTFAEVADDGLPRLVLLRGGPGTGKSRILQWLTEAAHESGAGTPLRAVHHLGRGPTHGLPRTLANFCCAIGLNGDGLRQRIASILAREGVRDDWEIDALCAVLSDAAAASTATADVPSSARFADEKERHAIVRQFLARTAAERPVILWMDDLHFGADTMDFLEFVLGGAGRLPVLLAGTLRDDELERRPLETAQVERLVEHPRTRSLHVGPLPETDHQRLVDRLLGLSPGLAAQVCRRTAGNPLFAVQLVGDWVARDALELAPDGFRVRDALASALPDDLHQLWSQRIDQVIGPFGAPARHLFELAAALGLGVDLRELHAALDAGGLDWAPDAVEAMAASGLLLVSEHGWQFAHPLLRDSFERSASETARWAGLQRACAAALAAVHADGTPGLAARRAIHLLDAGDLDDALPILTAAIEEAINGVNLPRAHELLARLDDTLAALRVPENDARHGHARILHADALRLAGDVREAGRLVRSVLDQDPSPPWQPLRARALVLLSNIARQEGRVDDALAHAEQACTLYTDEGDDAGLARAELAQAIAHRVHGDTTRAGNLYRSAMVRFARHRIRVGEAHCLLGLGHLARHQGDLRYAARLYERAEQGFAREGVLLNQAHCINGLAEVARFDHRLEDAANGYRRALGILEALSARSASIIGINLAIVDLQRGATDDARERLTTLASDVRESGQHSLLAYIHAGLLECAAREDDLDACRAHLHETRDQVGRSQAVDLDIALLADRAAGLLLDRGQNAEGAEAAAIALAQFEALGEKEGAERMRALLERAGQRA